MATENLHIGDLHDLPTIQAELAENLFFAQPLSKRPIAPEYTGRVVCIHKALGPEGITVPHKKLHCFLPGPTFSPVEHGLFIIL
jgi:hypothetical protein